MIRRPAVAGQFYPAEKISLKKEVERFIHQDAIREDIIGAVAPHAGFIYSGEVAGAVYSKINQRPVVIILGVNHRSLGKPFAIIKGGIWQTPLGEVKIDEDFSKRLLTSSSYLEEDELAHKFEHSLEVQLPFLQIHFGETFKIVPICIGGANIEAYQGLGREIASKIEDPTKVLIVASTDFTHYESQEEAQTKDKEAIKAILRLDEEELFRKVKDLHISMCGYAPTIAMISAVKALGAKEAKLVKYMTSGDVTGDYSQVVGYAGIIIK